MKKRSHQIKSQRLRRVTSVLLAHVVVGILIDETDHEVGDLGIELDATALESLHRSRIVISEMELLDFEAKEAHTVESMATLGRVRGRGPSAGWEGSQSDDSSACASSASSRIHVADTSALGLPEATIRIACGKGTYIRAFARDLGEALGSGAHLGGLVRSRSGDFSLEQALSLEDALSLFKSPAE